MEHSGKIVKRAMIAAGMTQAILADKIGRDQTLISRYFSGSIEISGATAEAIADVLNIGFDTFYYELRWDKYIRKRTKLETEFADILND